LAATDGTLTSATSPSFVVSAAAAAQLALGQQPTSSTAGVTLSPAVSVAVEDKFGNLVSTDTSTVTVSVQTGPGVFDKSSTTQAAAVNGVASFSALILDTAGAYTLSAADGALTSATTSSFTVSAAAAAQLAFLQQPTTGTVGVVLGPPSTVAVQDQFGNTVTSDSSLVSLTLGGGTPGAHLNGTTPVGAVNGVATFSDLSVDTPGTHYTLKATDGTLTSVTSAAFNITGPATQVVFTQQPSDTFAGAILDGSLMPGGVQVAIEDEAGNIVVTNTSTVTLTLGGGAPGAALQGTVSRAAVNGVVTFADLSIDTAGTGYSLTAADGTLTSATSTSFSINAAAATQVVFLQQPTNSTAGTALSPAVSVVIEDQFGNVVTSDQSTVTVAVQSGPGVLDGSSTQAAAVNGVATFSNLVLDTAGSYTLSATDASLSAPTSTSFTVSAAAAAQLAFSQQPTNATAGAAITPAVSVAVEDRFGNLVSTDTSTLTLSVHTGPGGFESGSTTQVAAVNGVATFNALVLDTAGVYTLSAADGTLSSATSTSFTVSAAAATQLTFSQQPTNSTAGTALSPAVSVVIEDMFGNIVTSDPSQVTLAVQSGPGVFDSGSTTQVAAVNGVAAFNALILDTAGAYTLSAADGALTSATSTSFMVSAAAAAQLAFSQQPTNATAGTALSPAVSVAVEDRFGNLVSTDTSTLTLSVQTGPGGFEGSSTTQVAAVNGVATFNTLILDTAGAYTLSAAVGTLSSATSTSFTVSAAAAAQLAFLQQPTNGTAGTALSPAVSVVIKDQFGNVVTTDQSTVTMAIQSGPGGFDSSSTTQVAAVNGVAGFSSLILDTAGAYTLSAADGALTSATSSSFTVSAAAPAQLAFLQQPTNGTAGTALHPAVTVTVEDKFGNLVLTSTVSMTVRSGPGLFDSSSSLQAVAVNGVATFSNLVLDTAGSYTLTATDETLTSAPSTSFVVSAAAAVRLAFGQQPSNSSAGAAISPAVTVAVEDRFGNLVASDTSPVTMAIQSGPGGFESTSTTQVAAVNGVASFSNLVLDSAGSYTLSATDGGLTPATSTSFQVSAGPAAQLAFSSVPTTGTAGVVLGPALTVAVEDRFGNLATADHSTVTIAVQAGPGSFASSSTLQVAASNGMATFRTLVLDTAGSYTLAVTDGSLTPAQAPIVVGAAIEPPPGFLTSLYRIVLGREPDVNGQAHWAQVLASGGSRAQVAQAFWESFEHRGQEVDQLYATYLHRRADPGSRYFWTEEFQAGMDESSVALAIVSSAEYQALHPTTAGFITAVYADGLGRQPDATGLTFWENHAPSAPDETAVAVGILHSGEETLHVLDQFYAQLLKRPSDGSGEQFWSVLMQSEHLSQSAVAAGFLASEEFYLKATTG
jgi:hypothetical protein